MLNDKLRDLRPADMISIGVMGAELARDTPERLFHFPDGTLKEPYDGILDAMDHWSDYEPHTFSQSWDVDVIENHFSSEVRVLNQFHLEYARSSDSI